MKLTEQQYELIEAYLNDELSATDRAAFEADLDQNAELRSEVQTQQALRLGFRALAIEKKLQQARQHWQITNKPAENLPEQGRQLPVGRQSEAESLHRPRWQVVTTYWWAAAAIAVLVLGISIYLVRLSSRSSGADLAYNEVYQPESSTDLTKDFPLSMKPDERVRFLEIVRGYKAGNYDEVISQLKILPVDQQTVQYKNYMLGLSYLANKEPKAAISYLRLALQTKSVTLHQKAEWFLALAYLKAGEKNKALAELKQVAATDTHPFQELAKKVLKRLK